MKKIWVVLITVVILVSAVTVFFINMSDNESENSIELIVDVYNKSGDVIYQNFLETNEKKLINTITVLEDLEMVTEKGPYGEYILSIKGIEQGDNYYWTYYVNDEYATVGISSYELNDNDKISFKIEKFEED